MAENGGAASSRPGTQEAPTRGGLPKKRTLTQLLEERKSEIIPDISYDLDGDGYVGGRDYVVARRFDHGFKNYLSKEEKEEAIEALKNGYESNFIWNVERSGHQR